MALSGYPYESISPLYYPAHVRIPLFAYDLAFKYVELVDQDCLILPHRHADEYELYYCRSGAVRFHAGPCTETLRSGDFILIAPTTMHSTVYEPDEAARFVSLHFSLSPSKRSTAWRQPEVPSEMRFFEQLLQTLTPDTPLLCRDKEHCDALFTEIEAELLQKRSGWQLMLRSLYLSLLVRLSRNLFQKADNTEAAAEDETRLHTSLNIPILLTKYMRANYKKDVSLQELAELCHLAPRQVERVFEKYFNETYKQTLTAYRIEHCKYWLRHSSDSLEAIAARIGFSSANALIRAFKQREGITPSQYRNQNEAQRQAGTAE